jgi:hypothetical protein
VQVFRDENDQPGLVALVRGLDPTFRLRASGRRTSDVEVGHLGFDDTFYVLGETAMVRAGSTGRRARRCWSSSVVRCAGAS